MKKALLVISFLGLLFPSCHRTNRALWEDTKTCGRYVNRGLHSLLGRHADRNVVVFNEESAPESEFLPLTDDDRYQDPLVKEYPISKESPGDPGSPIPGIEGFSTPLGRLAAVFSNVLFETDTYVVKGDENVEMLQKIADYLVKNPKTYIFIEGHADERGAASYNLALGSKRSNSVRSFLIEHGVSPDQLFTISYGKERPLALGHEEQAWSQNRRAQFKIYER